MSNIIEDILSGKFEEKEDNIKGILSKSSNGMGRNKNYIIENKNIEDNSMKIDKSKKRIKN